MLDYKTGRSRGFGFITFENEDPVEKIFSERKIHELGGKQVCQKSKENEVYPDMLFKSEMFLTVHDILFVGGNKKS